jgi:ElaB/YqjD/DUF883 family membrane-anchored ribosome-binding protein
MSGDRIEGAIKNGVGRVQDAAGGFVQLALGLQAIVAGEAAGFLQDAFGQVKDHAADILSEVTDQAGDVYGQVKGQTRGAVEKARVRYDDVEEFVVDNPLAAIGIAAGVGLLVGLILRGRNRD